MANPTLENNTIARRKPIGEALNTKDTLLPTLPVGQHNTTPPTLADGDVAGLQLDDLGNLETTPGDPAEAVLLYSNPMAIPAHDTIVIDESGAPATTVITYKTGGTGGTTVATKTITVSGTTTNIVVT